MMGRTDGPGTAGTPASGSRLRLAVGIAEMVVFCITLYAVITGQAAGFDDPVRNFFYGLRNDLLTPFVKLLTYLGNWESIVVLCLLLLAVKSTRITYGVPVSVGAAFVTVLNKTIKALVRRPRPDDIPHLIDEGGFSFPSGHSITSMFVFGMLIYLVRSNVADRTVANVLTVLLAIPMFGIGLSRIYVGVHFPTDVLGGWCLGIVVMAAMIEGVRRISRRKGPAFPGDDRK